LWERRAAARHSTPTTNSAIAWMLYIYESSNEVFWTIPDGSLRNVGNNPYWHGWSPKKTSFKSVAVKVSKELIKTEKVDWVLKK
jgi:hypothetical protein